MYVSNRVDEDSIFKYVHRRMKQIICMIVILACTITVHNRYKNILYNEIYTAPLPKYNDPLYMKFHYNLYTYLQKNHVGSLLEMKCSRKCYIQKDYYSGKINVAYREYLDIDAQEGMYTEYYDWVNFNTLDLSIRQFELIMHTVSKITRYGISFTYPLPEHNPAHLTLLTKIIKQNGFGYDSINSLKISRSEGKMISIFTRSTFITSSRATQPQKIYLSIHSTIRLRQDLPFLREWIGYHVGLGVEKFFLYGVGVEGDRLGCVDATDQQIIRQWQKIMQDYSNYIIYIPWHAHKISIFPPLSLIYSSTPTPQEDYLNSCFRFASEYTIFLEPDQMIFSPIGLPLTKQIMDLEKIGYESFQFQVKFFISRLCTRKRFMLGNYLYYELGGKGDYTINTIFKTQNYNSVTNTLINYLNTNKSYKFDKNIWRINSYSLDKNRIKQLQKGINYPNVYFSYDASAESRIQVVRQICHNKCYVELCEDCVRELGLDCAREFQKLVF